MLLFVMVTALSTCKIPSFTRRSGSRTVHSSEWSHRPWFVSHEVITTGPSIALIASSAVICDGFRASSLFCIDFL